jgi:hypothetical protein
MYYLISSGNGHKMLNAPKSVIHTVKEITMRVATILIFFFSSQLLATDFDVPAAKYDSIGLPDSSSGYECDIYMSEFRWEENYGPSFMLNAHTKIETNSLLYALQKHVSTINYSSSTKMAQQCSVILNTLFSTPHIKRLSK